MPTCNLTRMIPSNQCIGDSLRTINANFSALNVGICNVPLTIEENNVSVATGSDRYQRPVTQISTETPVVYQTQFNYKSSPVQYTTIGGFEDGTETPAYLFPYSATWNLPRPQACFDVASNGSGYPQITLYWMASSNTFSTVFATNSASATPATQFNESITALYKEENLLYVGGSFTSINGVDTNKFAVIDIQSGARDTKLGPCGSLAFNPLSGASKNLGTDGTVNCITKTIVNSYPLLLVGGTFNSKTLGRGLVIYNETLKLFYSFYVNGVVNNFVVDGNELYVVGEFDFLNYGIAAASEYSKQRFYCNGLAKISLSLLLSSPLLSIDSAFCDNVLKIFSSPATINSIAIQSDKIFVGGNFQIQGNAGNIIAKNIASFDTLGNFNENWLMLLNKPILTMYVDNPASILYVGGEFTTISSREETYVLKKELTSRNFFYRAAAFSLKTPQLPLLLVDWKPKFNDSVSKIIAHNSEVNSHLYIMGRFTEVNSNSVSYIAAITKATEFVTQGASGKFIPWNIYLSTAPSKFTNALVKRTQDQIATIFVGGNFTRVNGQDRLYLANVAGIGQDITNQDPSSVVFEAGGHIISQNQKFSLDFGSGVRSTAPTSPYGAVNKCSFPPIKNGFQGLTKNQLCRFYIRRPGNSAQNGSFSTTDDLYLQNVYILGWTVNFDSQKDI